MFIGFQLRTETLIIQLVTVCFNCMCSASDWFPFISAVCSQRLIGQKRQSSGQMIGTSCLELFSMYPTLYGYFLKKLQLSSSCQLQPEVFPVLTLLSALTPAGLTSDEMTQ